MITALDTNVLVSLWDDEDAHNMRALEALEKAFERGGIVICGAVYAEIIALPSRTEAFLNKFLAESGILVDWSSSESIWLSAGHAYSSYNDRRQKAKHPRSRRILTDFVIGAHAFENGYALLTFDDKIFRASFPRLSMFTTV